MEINGDSNCAGSTSVTVHVHLSVQIIQHSWNRVNERQREQNCCCKLQCIPHQQTHSYLQTDRQREGEGGRQTPERENLPMTAGNTNLQIIRLWPTCLVASAPTFKNKHCLQQWTAVECVNVFRNMLVLPVFIGEETEANGELNLSHQRHEPAGGSAVLFHFSIIKHS